MISSSSVHEPCHYHMPRNPTRVSLFVIRPQSFIASLVTLFVVIFVFEEAIYGRLGLSTAPYLIAKTATEAFLYLFLLLVMFDHMVKGRLWQYQLVLFDFCMATFLVVTIISTVINHGALVAGILNVRTMLRYMSIYYIIVMTGWMPSERQMMRFIRFLVGIALLQSALIILQHIGGDAFREAYFSPQKIEVVVSGVSKILGEMETKLGAGYGTFGKTPLAAFFLLLVAVITISMALSGRFKSTRNWWFSYAIILIGMYFSYKRAALLLALASPIPIAWFLGRKRLARRYIAIAAIIFPLLLALLLIFKPESFVKEKEEEVSPIESLAQLFSEQYWVTSSTHSRGWMIREVGQQALASFKPLGYGADEENAKAALATRGGEFAKLVGWGAFDDVYIVAGLVYYGPVGIVLLSLAFYSIFRQSRALRKCATSQIFRVCGASLSAILVLMFFSLFVSRVLEFRPFAFLLWVFAGVVVVALRKHRYSLQHMTQRSRVST